MGKLDGLKLGTSSLQWTEASKSVAPGGGDGIKRDQQKFHKSDMYWVDMIGTYFFSRPENLPLTHQVRNKPSIFDKTLFLDQGCVEVTKLMDNTGTMDTSSESSQKTKKTATESRSKKSSAFEINLGVLGAGSEKSVAENSKSSSDATENKSSKTSTMEFESQQRRLTITEKCKRWPPLHMDFIVLLQQLPMGISYKEDQKKYLDFLQIVGSHLILGMDLGMNIEMTSTIESSKKEAKTITADSLCQEEALSGGKSGGLPFMSAFPVGLSASVQTTSGGCPSKNDMKQQNMKSENTENIIYLMRGGTHNSRASLLTKRGTSGLLAQLKETSPVFQTSLRYHVEPIWGFLRKVYPKYSSNWNRFRNLEMIYNAWMALSNGKKRMMTDDILNKRNLFCNVQGIKPTNLNEKLKGSGLKTTVYDCQMFCEQTSNCGAYAFNQKKNTDDADLAPPKGMCRLYENVEDMGGVHVAHESDTTWTLNVIKCEDEELPKCAMKGRKAIGKFSTFPHGIVVPSAIMCQQMCIYNEACSLWNYQNAGKGGRCWLLSSLEKFEDDETFVTAPEHCTLIIWEDRWDNTIEMQMDRWERKSTFWNTLQKSQAFTLAYTSAQCLDMWKPLGKYGRATQSVDECAQKCHDTEGCFYFGYGTRRHSKQCFHAGYKCALREKNQAIDFDIYHILANQDINYSLMKNNNKCSGGVAYCNAENPANCDNPPNFAESVRDCASKCKEKYSSEYFAFATYNHMDRNSVKGHVQCLCYEGSTDKCTQENMNSHCKDGNLDKNPECYHSMYFILPSTGEVSQYIPCPSENIFITSSRSAIALHSVKSMVECCDICLSNQNCGSVLLEYNTKKCHLIPEPITTISKRTGWIACRRNGCEGIRESIKSFQPEKMWWSKNKIFV